ncbi:hypothetical protein GB937_003003 [Aspergillus fischeri]|nr:hypothetical protein GB937_003003 [Aspergillus fischeri]
MPKQKPKQKNPRPPSAPPQDGCECSCGCLCHAPPSTGMPIHVLSDVCHRKGWDEPETKTQTANGYLATVSMRSTLPSGESIVLPFAAPDSLRAAFTDTEEEIAKNNIAVYVLFCIGEHNSDLPRGWRGLWKREFERIKAVDVKEGRGWMYSGDLFGGYKRWQDSLYEA